MSDRFLVVLDSLARAASDIRRTSDAVRDGMVGALDDEVAVGHDVLQDVLGEFGVRWQLGLDSPRRAARHRRPSRRVRYYAARQRMTEA